MGYRRPDCREIFPPTVSIPIWRTIVKSFSHAGVKGIDKSRPALDGQGRERDMLDS